MAASGRNVAGGKIKAFQPVKITSMTLGHGYAGTLKFSSFIMAFDLHTLDLNRKEHFEKKKSIIAYNFLLNCVNH